VNLIEKGGGEGGGSQHGGARATRQEGCRGALGAAHERCNCAGNHGSAGIYVQCRVVGPAALWRMQGSIGPKPQQKEIKLSTLKFGALD
jgi:hypothetical protein